jgi:transposase
MEVLWLLHHGLTREKAATIVGVGVATVKRHANAYRDGGLDGLRRWGKKGQAGSLEARRELLAESFRERPT